MCHEQKALWNLTGVLNLPLLQREGGMIVNGKESYIAGLKRYHEKGIPIVIDGEESGETDWNRIFETREDNSFYMADFISDDATGKLKEIRFDRVYHK